MNKLLLLHWLLEDVKDYADKQYEWHKEARLEEDLYELNTRRDISLPPSLPKTPEKMMPILRKHFKDNVTFISLVLNHYFPEKYIFYRISKLEPEIFEGFEYFSEVAHMLELPFSHVGTKGLGRYLTLNEALLEFAHIAWPELKFPQINLNYFLYQGLGELFLSKSDYNRYWIVATQDQFDEFDAEERIVDWSGRKEMQPGDLVFVYRTAPRKAITDILRVKDEPQFDPWGAWDGFWVNLEKVCPIDDIPFSTMKNDQIFSQWGLVRRNFVGTVTEPIPHSIYNRILDKIPTAVKEEHNLKPEPAATVRGPGELFTSEADFEEKVIEPLLKRWGFQYKSQHLCLFHIGSQTHPGRIDFFVSDKDGPLTLFENKLRILSSKDLNSAVKQAKSYALLFGLPSFIVASPEGMWLYSLSRNEEKLVKKVSTDELLDKSQEEELRDLLFKLRQ